MGRNTAEFADGWWTAADGVRLHYRDYPGSGAHVPVLCVPGLTRNARDFAAMAERLAGSRRVIVVELRGRGMSDHARDAMTYQPACYLRDLLGLIDALGLERLVVFGTSLGGLLAMLLGASARPLLAGVLLNDIGPVLDPAGIARIRSYVGKGTSWPTWLHAAKAIAETHHAAFPDHAIADWLAMARRLCRLTPQGRIVQDYDMKIAEPFRLPPPEPAADLWPALESLAGMPAVLVRGGLSDVLSAATAEEMARRLPRLDVVTLPRIGHAPMLDEPECIAAIDRLLARV